MLILAIDSTMNGCSVCFWDSEQGCLSAQTLEMVRGQAEHLMPMVENMAAKSNKSYTDIDAIAVTNGPGTFTGMRIGLATAKALGLSLDIPVIGVSTFRAVLQSHLKGAQDKTAYPFYGVLLETKRKDYYFQAFNESVDTPYLDAAAIPANEVLSALQDIDENNILIIGDCFERFQGDTDVKVMKNEFVSMPDISAVAELAYREYTTLKEIVGCAPVYLRPPDVSMPKNAPRQMKT